MADGVELPEEETLAELREAEVDLSSPHVLEHLVSFPFRSQAEGAAAELRSRGFETEIEADDETGQWDVVARHRLVCTVRSLREARTTFEQFALLLGGEYDGWLVRLDEEYEADDSDLDI